MFARALTFSQGLVKPVVMRKILALAAVLSLSSTGCIKSMLLNGQIEATRKASPAVDTIADYELARVAASGGLAQLEGMHRLAPNNKNALFMLNKTWAGYGYGFVEDDYEAALADGKEALAEYHRKRAKNAYDRSIFYGLELMSHEASGFNDVKDDEKKLKAWLEKNFTDKEDAGVLFWTGYAWLAKTGLYREDNELMSFMHVAVTLLERSRALDPEYNHYTATVALASYRARSPMAGEMEQAKLLFDEALKAAGATNLAVKFAYATRYYCSLTQEGPYDAMLKDVLEAEDPDPEQRLTNTVTKRRAVRWSSAHWKADNCSMRGKASK